jgi:hypothetical protein
VRVEHLDERGSSTERALPRGQHDATLIPL